jgi:hypothetical protein
MARSGDFYPVSPQIDSEATFGALNPIAIEISFGTGVLSGMTDCRDIHAGTFDAASHAALIAGRHMFGKEFGTPNWSGSATASETDNPRSED